jgi:hypothetical protein
LSWANGSPFHASKHGWSSATNLLRSGQAGRSSTLWDDFAAASSTGAVVAS